VIEARAYPVRALVGFGLNLLLSHADAARGAEALRRLEFHVQSDLYLTPTAAYADIVLPVASACEREGLRVGFGLDQDACELVQFRPAAVAPRGEARADIDIVFDLAVRLGLGRQGAIDVTTAPSPGANSTASGRRIGAASVVLTRIAATEVRTEFAPASLLEGNGFELPVRGRGQPGCWPKCRGLLGTKRA
jgi:anaerobic selenocysteine-containing dehydrogenase